jgi:predicted alpha-1,6-mannanase (GH76 family)
MTTRRNRLLQTLLLGLLAAVLGGLIAPPAASAGGAGRNAARARAAAAVLAASYDYDTAYWNSSWWNSAVALTTVEDYAQRTGDTRYNWIIEHTYTVDKVPFPAGTRSSDQIDGDFISRAIDDTMWWALAWIQAYDVTHQRRYLNEAITIAGYDNGFWDTSTCGGGIWWNRERTYKNAITNGQYVRLTAALHNRIPGDTAWLARTRTAWTWYVHSGLINSSTGLVNDGLTDSCQNNGQTVWTYNQGLAIGGAVEVYRATHDPSALATARKLADAALAAPTLVQGGVLTESCDVLTVPTCDDNQKQFKGIFTRYLGDLADVTHAPTYRKFLENQVDTLWAKDRTGSDEIGQIWSGQSSTAHQNMFDWRTQASGLEAILATLPARH